MRAVPLPLLVVLLAGLLTACRHTPPPAVTEAELLGTWRSVNWQLSGPPRFYTYTVRVYRQRGTLFVSSDQGLEFGRLTAGGDSLDLMQGCFKYKWAVSFQKARPGSRDTLFVAHLGKLIRLDSTIFRATRRARNAAVAEQQRLFDLRHGWAPTQAAAPVAARANR